MKIPLVDLGRQHSMLEKEIHDAIYKVINESRFILGEEVSRFEENFARFCGKKYAVATKSGTDALMLALKAYNVKGRAVTVPNTHAATAMAIVNAGAELKFVDINPETYNMGKLSGLSEIGAIVPVHLYGLPADMDYFLEIAKYKEIPVIEDCCQAHGAEYKGKKVPVGETGVFSFYPGKNLGAFGDCGAVVTDNEEIAKTCRMMRWFGSDKSRYEHEIIGFNTKPDTIQAAVLNVKLKYLPKWVKARRANAKLYNKNLEEIIHTPAEANNRKHAYHLYVIESENRDGLLEYLNNNGIGAQIHYPIPLHIQPAFKFADYVGGNFPFAEKAAKRILSLPMFPEIKKGEIDYVCEKISDFSKKQQK